MRPLQMTSMAANSIARFGTSLLPSFASIKSGLAGDVDSRYIAAYCLNYGRGGAPKKPKAAQFWFQMALQAYLIKAREGDVRAQIMAASMYHKGWGTGENHEEAKKEARKWYRKATEAGNTYAQWQLAGLYRGIDEGERVKWAREAAEGGHPMAMDDLALYYSTGDGVPKDLVSAMKWMEKSALAGHVPAQLELGNIYACGVGVPQDYDKAMAWYRKAAANGASAAERKLSKSTHKFRIPRLFDVPIVEATRDRMREALKKSGVRAVREDDRYWSDIYDASRILKGASELSLGYTMEDGRLGRAAYSFPSPMDADKVAHIKAMIASKYGPPTFSEGDPRIPVPHSFATMADISRRLPDKVLAFILLLR